MNNESSTFDSIRKPLTSFSLGFAYRWMLDNEVNTALMYGSIVGLSDILGIKAREQLLPDFSNEALNTFKNIAVQGSLAGSINAGLQYMINQDVLYLENFVIGGGAAASSILLEPTIAKII